MLFVPANVVTSNVTLFNLRMVHPTEREKANVMKIKPKLVIMTHSSGTRTAFKFLEKIKSSGLKTDLVFSIDPVKEAHHAFEEVSTQQMGQAAHNLIETLPFVELKERKPLRFWSRQQPKSLYKPSNTKKWVNVYQMSDTEGIKMNPKFGIYGSPISNAYKNYFVKDGLKGDARGGIASHPDILKFLKQNLLSL